MQDSFFEAGIQTFQIKRSDINGKTEKQKITAFEEKIKLWAIGQIFSLTLYPSYQKTLMMKG